MEENNLAPYSEDTQVVEIQAVDMIEQANVDVQVATAKKYPRNLDTCVRNATYMATMDKETAKTMGYALPRGGKPITGPTVHLARIVASCYGNLRTEAKVVRITDTQVISRGIAWDLENNTASAFEVRRNIVDGKGKKFSQDMITVTGNAASAIAYRNAVFNVIPRSVWYKPYQAAQNLLVGDLSSEDKINNSRINCIKTFKNEFNISEEDVIKLTGKQTINQLQREQLVLLSNIAQALRDGDTTVDEVLKTVRTPKEEVEDKKKTLREKKQQQKVEMP